MNAQNKIKLMYFGRPKTHYRVRFTPIPSIESFPNYQDFIATCYDITGSCVMHGIRIHYN